MSLAALAAPIIFDRQHALRALRPLYQAWAAQQPAEWLALFGRAAFYYRAVEGWAYVPAFDWALRAPLYSAPTWKMLTAEYDTAARMTGRA